MFLAQPSSDETGGLRMKVAVTDFTFPNLEIEEAILSPAGFSLIGGQCKTPEALIPFVRDADAIIAQFAPINADVIAAMDRARVIVRYGIGVDNVDLKAAHEKGIPVCNVPDYCIDEVADHTLAFILAATRRVVPHTRSLQEGKWGLVGPLSGMKTLRDLTVGMIGFGRIGREVASRLGPFKCRRLVYDPVLPNSSVLETGCEPSELATLLAESDVVTLHCPSTPQTRRILNGESISRMRPGSIVINLARGDLIDTASMIRALQDGHLAFAALDVFDPEPIPADSPLLTMDNVILAPHIASASVKAARKLRETVASTVLKALQGEPLSNIVNGVIPAAGRST